MPVNPFTPTFGIIPPYMAGRESLIEELSCAYADGLGNPNLCTIISGARGTGKTALLSFMAQEAESQGLISAKTTAAPGMLEDIYQQTVWNARNFIDTVTGPQLKGFTLGQLVGVEWDNVARNSGNWRTQMNRVLDQLDEHDVGLLITVDEVKVTVDEMKQLARVYQHFVTEGRRVALLMAGLPHNVSQLLRDDDISFLRRARKHSLGRITDAEIEAALVLTVEGAGKRIELDALREASLATDGFPYMMQLVGYYSWLAARDHELIVSENVAAGVKRAREEMIEGVLEFTYLDLSAGDKKFLAAMIDSAKDVALSKVAERMGVKSNYASQYKRRLLEQGIIGEPVRGYVRFDMPAFKEYFAMRYEEEVQQGND